MTWMAPLSCIVAGAHHSQVTECCTCSPSSRFHDDTVAFPLLWLQGMQMPLVAFRITHDAGSGLVQTTKQLSAATAVVAAERPMVGRSKEMQLIMGRVAEMLRDKQGSANTVIIEGNMGEWLYVQRVGD